MSTFNAFKKSQITNSIIKPLNRDLDRVPKQISDYMNDHCNRFSEICKLYLECMTIDDLPFMLPEDLINLVPPEQYRHKLLMSIMVRRYLYPTSNTEKSILSEPTDNYENIDNITEYLCPNCPHICNMKNCSHPCNA